MAAAAPAGPTPTIFAPGVISGPANDGSPSFTPDRKTLFFTRSGSSAGAILESHLVDGRWAEPEIASFSGQWNDEHAVVAPDGSYLVFVSTRPVDGIKDRVAHIWRVDREGAEWGTPQHLSAAVNIGPRIFAPSIAADGTIYFLSIGDGRALQLYRSRNVNGTMQHPEPLAFSSPATADVDPEIALDQSYLVFSSAGRRGKDDQKEHLYVVYNHHGSWGTAAPMGYDGDDANGSSNDNEPSLNPSGDTLYFSSDRTLPPVLPRTRPQAEEDLRRIASWDNGNTNVWSIPMPSGPDAKGAASP